MNSMIKKNHQEQCTLHVQKTENNLSALWGLLFGIQQGYNLQNQYQPLFRANYNCFKNKEGLVKENKVIA